MNLKTGFAALAIGVVAMFGGVAGAFAQDVVVEAKDKEALYTSQDPALNANKQVVYHIVKVLPEAGQWGGGQVSDRALSAA